MIQMYNRNLPLAETAFNAGDYVKSATAGRAVPNPIKKRNNIYLSKTHNSLISIFNKYFEIVPAVTPEKLVQAYRIRYEVYCKEGLIPGFYPEDYPDGLEYDQYDERSVHSLLMHKPSGLIAGAVRIILPDQNKIDAKFPLEKFASNSLYTEIKSLKSLSRIHVGEISRLILTPEFRKYWREDGQKYIMEEEFEYLFQPENQIKTNTSNTDLYYYKNFKRQTASYPIFGLFVAIVQMSIKHNLKYWYAGMEPGLAKFCRIFGIDFTPISPIVDYYGPCRSYLGYIPDIMKSIYCTNMPLWALLTNDGVLIPRPNQLIVG